MVVFGAPVSLEDGAFRAYLAVAHTDGAVHALRLCYLFSPLR